MADSYRDDLLLGAARTIEALLAIEPKAAPITAHG
jgi:hypothetical protein